MLTDLKIDWLSLDDLGLANTAAETGNTFYENAALKAETYAIQAGLMTLADDSGLEVDVLGGQPGIYTARYGGEALDQVERNQLLLSQLAGVPWGKRTARFRAAIVLAAPDGTILGASEGVCEGLIATAPEGEGGFGYDPVFYLPEVSMTMAQLDAEAKAKISHRGRALRAIDPLLRRILTGSHCR